MAKRCKGTKVTVTIGGVTKRWCSPKRLKKSTQERIVRGIEKYFGKRT